MCPIANVEPDVDVGFLTPAQPNIDVLLTVLRNLDQEYRDCLYNAEQNIRTAFTKRYSLGQNIVAHYNQLMDEFGSQKAIAEALGQSESQISNTIRGYKYLRDAGADTIESALALLDQKQIKPTSQNYEKIGTLLNSPDENTSIKEQKSRDEMRMEQIQAELEEIVRRNERASDPMVQETVSMLEFFDDMSNHLTDQNIFERPFKSERYLDFVRAFGFDIVTRQPIPRCDPHHTDPAGGSGGMGTKLPDWMTIPVSRQTHQALENGTVQVTERDILYYLVETMATFIVNALDNGKYEK